MKKLIVLLALVVVAVGVRAALPQPDLVAQIHFAGAQKFSAAASAAAFTVTSPLSIGFVSTT